VARLVFRAMGTVCRVILVGGDEEGSDHARRRVEQLEARWSRFRADSEISRLNRRAGRPTALSGDSFLLVGLAVAAWHRTGGRYDPTVLGAVEAAGYDRSFEQMTARAGWPGRPAGPTPGCAGVTLDHQLRTVTLPTSVRLDPGGIGKGLAADLVVRELVDRGARGACVELGGDLRVHGVAPGGGPWPVGVGDPYDPAMLVTELHLSTGGVATSSRRTRRWSVPGGERHHLLDPATGRSLDNGLDAVTVVAPEAWQAEILAKAAFVAGPLDAPAVLGDRVDALLVAGPGRAWKIGPWARTGGASSPPEVPVSW